MSIYSPEEFSVDPYDVTSLQIEKLLSLVTQNSNETEIDAFLKKNRSVLAFISVFFSTGHQGCWVLPQPLIKPRIGSKKGLKPDYLFAGDNSDGVTWWVLELKGETKTFGSKIKMVILDLVIQLIEESIN